MSELQTCTLEGKGEGEKLARLHIGAAITLTQLERQLRSIQQQLPEHACGNIVAILDMLPWFAGRQIKVNMPLLLLL